MQSSPCANSHAGERAPGVRLASAMTTALIDPEAKGAAAGLRYWELRRGEHTMPARADIDPLHIPALLPQVFLIDVRREPLDFDYRLLGTQIVRHSEADYTGKSLRDLPAQCPPSQMWSLFQRVVEERRPYSAEVPYLHLPGKSVEILATPLSDDGSNVNMIFGVVQFDPSLPLPTQFLAKRQQVAF